VASAQYAGVEKLSAAERDLPLPLRNDSGALLPGTHGRKVTCRYEFIVDCVLCCAADIVVVMTPAIYQPAPATWGLAALGVAPPPGMDLSFSGGSFAAVQAQQQVMVAPVGVMAQPMQQPMQHAPSAGPGQMAPQQDQQQVGELSASAIALRAAAHPTVAPPSPFLRSPCSSSGSRSLGCSRLARVPGCERGDRACC
jgi:hypothetical protein